MPMMMPSVAPLFLESQNFSSLLNLVNELSVPVGVTIDVYSLDGGKAASQMVMVAPYGLRQLSMPAIFAGSAPLQWGSIRVTADHTAGLVGALSRTYRGSASVYLDEELAMPSMEGSNVYRGVATDAGSGSPVTAITSLSSAPQKITVTCLPEVGSAHQNSFELGPNQTLVTTPCSDGLSSAVLNPAEIENPRAMENSPGRHTAEGISVASDAMPGEFAVYGIVPHRSSDSLSYTSINFSDPRTRRSSGSAYVGIPVGPSLLLADGNYTPEVSVTNFGPNASSVTLEAATTRNGTAGKATLSSFVLASGATRTIPTGEMPLSPELTNGLVIHTDASPGDVLSKLVSYGGPQQRVVEVLDKDSEGSHNAGGHPWNVEPGVTSTLLLFNGDEEPQKVNLRFGTSFGLWMRRFTLQPMETRAVNINELIRMQEKDDDGLSLSANASSGEIGWQADSTRVSGRLLQSSPLLGMARSFSCSQWFYACSFNLSPSPSLSLFLNNTGGLSETPDWAVYQGFHPPTSCSCSNPSSGNTTLYDSWTSGNSAIATITSGATTGSSIWQGLGVGSTTSYFSGTNIFQAGGMLICQVSQPAAVNPLIMFGGANVTNQTTNVVVGQLNSLTATLQLPSGVTVSSQSWAVKGNPIAGFTANQVTSQVLPYTPPSSSATSFYWAFPGNFVVSYSVTLSDGTKHSASATFNVESPGYTVNSLPGTITLNGSPLMLRDGIPGFPVLTSRSLRFRPQLVLPRSTTYGYRL